MEGLIPFVIDAIRRSQEHSGYRCVSPDGSSHGGGGSSRRHLIDYRELAGAAEEASVPATGAGRRTAEDERGRPPAAVAAGAAYRPK
uniref:Uncharacterized protein n=1 Tax=Oryza brachyantha TaxID=4533 RepID=J3MMI4_ORYBR